MECFLLPPVPAFYQRPQSIDDVIDQAIGKTPDVIGIAHSLFQRWSGPR
jgi:flavin prenyltransferase